MKVQYFKDTDTLYIEFRSVEIVESRDLDEDTVIDLDAKGNICAMTMEHAQGRTNVPQFTFEEIAA
jgi:uncharacterized protein YuzE